MDFPITNRYRIEKELGAGGMGLVHLALDRLTDTLVALKQVKIPTRHLLFMSRTPAMLADELRLSLAREFQILATLRHPNIISVLDYGFDHDQRPFYTMTYLPQAQTILDASRGLALPAQVDLIQQMLQALAYLHRRGIFHRDLKPENVLVVDGHARVLDFGLAVERTKDTTSSSQGTLAYWAPELWMGDPFTEATDLFAFGVIAFKLVTGEHPFGPVDAFLMNRVLDEAPQLALLPEHTRLAAVFNKLLEKDPQARYKTAQAVMHDLNQCMGVTSNRETAVIRESYLQAATFVGRDAEMQQLQAALAQAKEGTGAVWLIGGESGVGKSRLVDELRAYALVDGWQVHAGQAQADGRIPYQLWQNVIPRLALNAKLSELELGVLHQIAPDMALLFAHDIPQPPKLGGAETRQRLLLILTALLQQQSQPTLLLLEDLQWAHESLAPIKQMLQLSEQVSGLVIVGTFRMEECPDLPAELPGAHLLQLQRLSAENIRKLSLAMLGEQANTPHITALLAQETEGNTFFIVEVMRALAEEAGALDKIGTMTLPPEVFTRGMQQLLQRRIQRIPGADQFLLQLAAIAGRQLDLHLLQTMAPEQHLDQWLQHAADTAVLTVRENQWLFSHDKLRESILANLDRVTLQSRRRQVAEALEKIYPENKSYFEALLGHWHGAGEVDKEIYYLNLVAEQMITISADYEHVRTLLKRGLALLPQKDRRRITLGNRLGQSYWRQGDYQLGHEQHQQALDLALELDDQSGIAASYSNLGLIAFYQGDYQLSRNFYQKSMALNEAMGNQVMLDYNFNNLGNLEAATGNLDQANAYFQKCLEFRETLDDEYLLSTTLNNLGNVATFQADYDQAKAYYERGLVMQKSAGNQFSLAMTLNNLGNIAFYQQDFAKSIAYLQESIVIYRQIGEKYGVAMCLINLGFAYLKMQDGQAHQAFAEALAFAHSVQATPFVIELIVGFAGLYLQANRPVRAAELAGLAQLYQENYIDVKMRLDELTPLLTEAMNADALATAFNKGHDLDLDVTVEKLLNK